MYCDTDILRSFDAFAASHLDHVKPKRAGGSDDSEWNRALACGVCYSLKGAFDPCPGSIVSADNFKACIETAREFIDEKRNGVRNNSYWRDYQYWLQEMKRNAAAGDVVPPPA